MCVSGGNKSHQSKNSNKNEKEMLLHPFIAFFFCLLHHRWKDVTRRRFCCCYCSKLTPFISASKFELANQYMFFNKKGAFLAKAKCVSRVWVCMYVCVCVICSLWGLCSDRVVCFCCFIIICCWSGWFKLFCNTCWGTRCCVFLETATMAFDMVHSDQKVYGI